jgi:type IV secretory pathway TraG/TraD family ATPase VirD4
VGTGTLMALSSFSAFFASIPPALFVVLPLSAFLLYFLLRLRFVMARKKWLKLWLSISPFLFSSIFLLPGLPIPQTISLLFSLMLFLAVWGYFRFRSLWGVTHLYTERFARRDELAEHLLALAPATDGLLLGMYRYLWHVPTFFQFACVRSKPAHRELGNLLIVAPTRMGKGLLAVSQLLTWKESVVVNDIKGDLFTQTAGYRATLGPVIVIDPLRGVGNSFDPLAGKTTEEQFSQAANFMLYDRDERDPVFTNRAIVMLTQMLLAAHKEHQPALPYVRSLIRMGLEDTVSRLNRLDPELATQFLSKRYENADFESRFLNDCWSTLTTKVAPLLTETLARCFTRSDFSAEDLMCGTKPVTVYLRWKEKELQFLSPLIRLLWGTLINELITCYDQREGKGCRPVLMMIDEAGRTAIPSLADQASTVVGRKIYLWVAVQSLAQLEERYGRLGAQIIRDNMEQQIFYRPTDLATAKHLEDRCGNRSDYAHSTTSRVGTETSEGRSERPLSLINAQAIMRMKDDEIIGFHRHLYPFRMHRVDWRQHTLLKKRHGWPPPLLSPLPVLPVIPALVPIGNMEVTEEEDIDLDDWDK